MICSNCERSILLVKQGKDYNMKLRNFVKCITLMFITLGMTIMPLACAPAQDAKTQSFTFVQIADTQLGFSTYDADIAAFKQAVKQINQLKPDFVVIAGDLVNVPGEKAYDDFKEIKSTFDMPCYCASGNHDVGQKPTAETLKMYRDTIGQDYYSFQHKGYVFVVINTQLWKHLVPGETETQDAWLGKTLADAKQAKMPVVIVGHIPIFTEKADEADAYYNIPLKDRKRLLKLFKDSGVVAVLTGHRHARTVNDYEGIQLVTSETTSKNFDKRPRAFFLWRVESPTSVSYEAIQLDDNDK